MKRKIYVGVTFAVVLIALAIGSSLLQKRAVVHAAGGTQAPRFEVDPMWPKPLPNHWIMGQTIGVSVDAQGSHLDHPSRRIARSRASCTPPPIRRPRSAARPRRRCSNSIRQGNLIGHWGGPGKGYDWPDSNHGITVDYKGNVWIGGNGRGARRRRSRRTARARSRRQNPATNEGQVGGVQPFNDNMVLKFTQDGKFLMQIGKPGHSKGSNDIENLRLPAKTFVDPKTNELYVADGYGNHRVIVFDADTGKYKRHWGAYGHKPDDADHGPLQSQRSAAAAVPQSRALRRALARQPAVRLRPRQRPHPGLQTGRHFHQGNVHRQRTRWAPARRGTSRSRRIRSRSTSIWPTAKTTGCTSSTATRSKC